MQASASVSRFHRLLPSQQLLSHPHDGVQIIRAGIGCSNEDDDGRATGKKGLTDGDESTESRGSAGRAAGAESEASEEMRAGNRDDVDGMRFILLQANLSLCPLLSEHLAE